MKQPQDFTRSVIPSCIRRWRMVVATTALLVLAACGGGGGRSSFTETAAVIPIQAGLTLANVPPGRAVIGEAYAGKVVANLNDVRNSITGYTVSNPTSGGAVPTVAADGTISWTPNAADINTSALTVTINMAAGDTLTSSFTVPISVYVKTLEMSQDIVANQSTYSDPEGTYTVQIGVKPGSTPNGKIQLYSYRSAAGSVSYSVVSTDENVFGILTSSPISNVVISGITTQSNTSKEAANYNSLTGKGLKQNNEWNEFGVEAMGSVLTNNYNTYTIRNDVALLFSTEANGHIITSTGSVVNNQQLLQIDSSCKLSANECNSDKAPVILIHGFNAVNLAINENVILRDQSLGMIGGGEGTWGSYPQLLIDAKHDVFEFRWVTYMRFEEAAGQLAKLIKKVAQKTGKKPILVAHSFGGILGNLALSGQGIEWKNNQWEQVKLGNGTMHDPRNVVAKLITIGSPIGGIYSGATNNPLFSNPLVILTMPWGRQDEDWTIRRCVSITCIQAGATDANIDSFRDQIAAIQYPAQIPTENGGYFNWDLRDTYIARRNSGTLLNYAESIARIGKISTGNSNVDKMVPILHGVDTLAIIGVGSSGFNPKTDAIGMLGDGLISLQGQIHPNDMAVFNSFYDRSYILSEQDYLLRTGFLTSVNSTVSNMKYVFVGNMAHTNVPVVHRNDAKHEIPEPYVAVDGKIDICENISHTTTVNGVRNLCDGSIWRKNHPLISAMKDSDYMDMIPIPYIDASVSVAPFKINGKITKGAIQTNAGENIPFGLDVRDRTTGDRVLRSFTYATNVDGTFEVDLNSLVDATVTGFNRANLYLNLYLGDGVTYDVQRVTIQNLNQDQISIPEIILQPIANRAGMVDVTGRVINGQTTNVGIGDAVIRIARGSGLTATSLQSVSNSNTSRTVGTDATGYFSIPQLRPGVYSALVKKTGFVDEIQGSLTVSANGVLTLSLLPTFAANQAAVTLRWGSAAGGAGVASDLDSHFLRFSASNSLEYHINYGAKTGLNGDSLDRDDTDYEGPETISFTPQATSNYVYYVHNFGREGSIPGSNPLVIVRVGSLVYRFDLPVSATNTARYWRVFDMVNGVVRPCAVNCLQTTAPLAITTQSGTLAPLSLDVRPYLTNLPTKH